MKAVLDLDGRNCIFCMVSAAVLRRRVSVSNLGADVTPSDTAGLAGIVKWCFGFGSCAL
jgi:hypothetical protein